MSLKIDYKINSWLDKDDLKKNKEYLNKLLNLGYLVSNLSQITFNPESSILDPINKQFSNLTDSCFTTYQQMTHLSEMSKSNVELIKDKLIGLNNNITHTIKDQNDGLKQQYNNLSTIINKLTGDMCKSSIKGKIGENFLSNLIINSFPDDVVSVMSQTPHEADIHLESKTNPKILIESKLYKNTVNTTEIEKFYKDLNRTGINYGLFISLTSCITGHKRLEYEYRNNKHVIYIPNAGFEGISVIYGIIFLKEMSKLNHNTKSISSEIIDEKCKLIYNSLTCFDKIFEHLAKIKDNAIKSKHTIDMQISSLISNIFEGEILIKNLINNLKKNITESLSDLNNNYDIILPNELDILLKNLLHSDNKTKQVISKLLKMMLDNNLNICDQNGKYIVLQNNTSLCEFKIGKTKSICEFSNGLKYTIKPNCDILQFEKILKCVL